MTRTTDTEPRTRPTDEIDPMVPMLPRTEIRTDGGRTAAPEPTPEPPLDTTYATEYDRGTEEIAPMVSPTQ
jgi:hypothetical protein